MRYIKLLLISFLFVTAVNYAQVELPKLSPKATVSQVIGYTNVTVEYYRPGVKGRTVWGDLVPLNKVWRTGANDATTIEFSTDVIIDNKNVPAGKYSFFTIPNNSTTVILNKVWKQWGAYDYKQEEDLMRFTVYPEADDFTEWLTFSFTDLSDSSATFNFNWERVKVSFKINVDVVKQAVERIKEATGKAKPEDFKTFNTSAEYLADKGIELEAAAKYADAAISANNSYLTHYVKAKVLFKQNKFTDSLKELDLAREAGRNDKNYEFFVSRIDLLEKQVKAKL
ncbi:MAG: DUF2911 domain-containing protein [Ignavibacteriaceae bacterium]|jgi:hypothetical protein|nr:DUF2911 domain-containing protein [Ignavibacteriaceae bacterium]